jgi:hypothetical protein
LISGNKDTGEDILIKDAQGAYVKYIYNEPWYKFNFAHWVKKIWFNTSFFGENFIRKIERKLFFTVEFLFKHLYGGLLNLGARLSYAPPELNLYLWIRSENEDFLKLDERIKILKKYPEKNYIITIPRWQGFNELMPLLAKANINFVEISGNDDLALSIINNKNIPYRTEKEQVLFTTPVLSDNHMERIILTTSVSDLGSLLRRLFSQGVKLEHLYDY